MKFIYNDGGRAAAGFKGHADDCVVRAIAIATELPYIEVYNMANAMGKEERPTARRNGKRSSARTGVFKPTIRALMARLSWAWTPTMGIGTGARVHLVDGELPMGRLVVSVSRHLTAVIDGVVHDTHDPQRKTWWYDKDGNVERISERCVYGYWRKA